MLRFQSIFLIVRGILRLIINGGESAWKALSLPKADYYSIIPTNDPLVEMLPTGFWQQIDGLNNVWNLCC